MEFCLCLCKILATETTRSDKKFLQRSNNNSFGAPNQKIICSTSKDAVVSLSAD